MSATSIRHYLNIVESRTTHAEAIVSEGPGRFNFLNQLKAAAVAGGVLSGVPTSHYVDALQTAGDAGQVAAMRVTGKEPFATLDNGPQVDPEVARLKALGPPNAHDKALGKVQKKHTKHMVKPIEDESVMTQPVGNGNGIRG